MGAMLIRRWLVSRLLRCSREQRLLMISLLIATTGFLGFWLAPSGTTDWLGAGAAGRRAGRGRAVPHDQLIGPGQRPRRIVEAIGSSIFLLPLLLARLADWFGMRSAFSLELALLAIAILLAAWAGGRKEPLRLKFFT